MKIDKYWKLRLRKWWSWAMGPDLSNISYTYDMASAQKQVDSMRGIMEYNAKAMSNVPLFIPPSKGVLMGQSNKK